MPQVIRFGIGLDAISGDSPLGSPSQLVLGPAGLLRHLESLVGLPDPVVARPLRVLQMRDCLLAARTGQRFFEKSFDLDEFGTASTLLAWRDDWHAHGWAGTCAADDPARVVDMAAVEVFAHVNVAPGTGDRLLAVTALLQAGRLPLPRVEMNDSLASLPLRWQDLLSVLPTVEAPALAGAAWAGSSLRRLQDALLDSVHGIGLPAGEIQVDESFTVVRAETALASSQWVADLARANSNAGIESLVLAEQQAGLLAAALDIAAVPFGFGGQVSKFRPALQLVELSLRLLVDPIDFTALLQFLTHPVNPISLPSRQRLVARMTQTPGLGGADWSRLLHELAGPDQPDHADRLADLRYWLEHPRFGSKSGIPVHCLIERATRVALFFESLVRTQADPDCRRSFVAGYEAAVAVSAILKLLKTQGMSTLGEPMLDKLLAQALAAGSAGLQQAANPGRCGIVKTPAAMTSPAAQVVWWHMAAPRPVPHSPWSACEIAALRQAGADLPDAALASRIELLLWLRPILMARDKLTLVLPPPGEEIHPVWWILRGLLADVPIAVIEDLLVDAPVGAGLSPVVHRALPAQRRWWRLSPDTPLNWSKPYSFTSLELLLFNPYQWVLAYPAQLRASVLASLPDEFTLMGSLAHRLLELLFRTQGSLGWGQEAVLAWVDEHLMQLIIEEGALLLMQGRKAELVWFQARLRIAVVLLHALLHEAGVSEIKAELPLRGTAVEGDLRGTADLVLAWPCGERMVLDLKWGGAARYRGKLEGGTHLQLALYAQLLKQGGGGWPRIGYFILQDAILLTPATDVFNGVRPVEMDAGSTTALWQQFLASWDWRARQFKTGQIELTLAGIEADESSLPPDGCLPAEVLNPRYNRFANLAGWAC